MREGFQKWFNVAAAQKAAAGSSNTKATWRAYYSRTGGHSESGTLLVGTQQVWWRQLDLVFDFACRHMCRRPLEMTMHVRRREEEMREGSNAESVKLRRGGAD